ncbi:MAG: hypothetical protein IJO32_01705 [Bacilli bacterium]|nr:hypothetical protein [Bacilli bacterium]
MSIELYFTLDNCSDKVKVDNPSSTNIYKICKIFNITLKEFFDSELFNFEKIID